MKVEPSGEVRNEYITLTDLNHSVLLLYRKAIQIFPSLLTRVQSQDVEQRQRKKRRSHLHVPCSERVYSDTSLRYQPEAEPKAKKPKDDSKALSPDEEQIKRLKVFLFLLLCSSRLLILGIVACVCLRRTKVLDQ